MKNIGILWAQYGPYHLVRARALEQEARPESVHLIELSSKTVLYDWARPESNSQQVHSLFTEKPAEELDPSVVFQRTRKCLKHLDIDVCLLPGYAPGSSLAAMLAAKSLGVKTVMMNESHAGTARATGARRLLKGILARSFDAALVGGTPQKRYFTGLGLPAERILTGYDCVDNDLFARRADSARRQEQRYRRQLGLPERYFLSLGRLVAKKNLPVLIRAYQRFLRDSSGIQPHLVLVGSGEQELHLKRLCVELSLPVYRRENSGTGVPVESNPEPGVHFYGFRQIEENPVFYALAEAFILPSSREEWGLVVNEAMACGLPVVVSRNAGCAEDLLGTFERGHPENQVADPIRPLLTRRLGPQVRRNGFVFDPDSAQQLSTILAALAESGELRAAMARASREIVGRFSCAHFARSALKAVRVALNEDQT